MGVHVMGVHSHGGNLTLRHGPKKIERHSVSVYLIDYILLYEYHVNVMYHDSDSELEYLESQISAEYSKGL